MIDVLYCGFREDIRTDESVCSINELGEKRIKRNFPLCFFEVDVGGITIGVLGPREEI